MARQRLKSRLCKLSRPEIDNLLNVGLPYRLSLLRLGITHCPAHDDHDNACVEAGVLNGRLLMEFLGLRSLDGETIEESQTYHDDGDDVKAPDVGGRFVPKSDFAEAEDEILAAFYYEANKRCAHFTLRSLGDPSMKPFDAALICAALKQISFLVRKYVPRIAPGSD